MNDHVMKAVADTICIGIQQSNHQPPTWHNIAFVREGERAQVKPRGLNWAASLISRLAVEVSETRRTT